MASLEMIARLADLREYEELVQYWQSLCEEEVQRLARKTFAMPEHHERLEWERLKARWDGIEEALGFPIKQRDKQRKNSV